MKKRKFHTKDNAELRRKIDEAKHRLPLPTLMRELGYGDQNIGETALCPFHDDHNPSFSVFQKDGVWLHKCFVGCSSGDEIAFLLKHFGFSGRDARRKAINHYLDMAGFPARRPSESREYPKSHVSPEFPVCPVSPVSEGQVVDGQIGKMLKALAGQSACTQLNTARTRRFKLLRDLKAGEKQIGRKLQIAELTTAFDEWHRLSLPFLDSAKTREQYEAKFLSEYPKVRFATGEGTLATALENVAKLPLDQLPIIPRKPNAPESWRRLLALHFELFRLRGKPTHFLSYRDAAKVFDGMSHQEAHDITGALETLGAIKIVSKGKPGLNSGEAAEFRYLLAEAENGNGNDAGLDGF